MPIKPESPKITLCQPICIITTSGVPSKQVLLGGNRTVNKTLRSTNQPVFAQMCINMDINNYSEAAVSVIGDTQQCVMCTEVLLCQFTFSPFNAETLNVEYRLRNN